MNLSDLFYQLANAELSQTFIGTGDNGSIPLDKRKVVTNSIVLGLDDLYREFLIKETSVEVPMIADTYTYSLSSETDLIKIERIEDEDGIELPLNDLSDSYSIITTSYNEFTVPTDSTSSLHTVHYRAKHPELSDVDIVSSPETVNIELPTQFLKALLLFVASRVYAPLTTDPGLNLGAEYLIKYEAEKQRLKELNVAVERTSETSRFYANGWT